MDGYAFTKCFTRCFTIFLRKASKLFTKSVQKTQGQEVLRKASKNGRTLKSLDFFGSLDAFTKIWTRPKNASKRGGLVEIIGFFLNFGCIYAASMRF